MKCFIIIIASFVLGMGWTGLGTSLYGDDYVKVRDSGNIIEDVENDGDPDMVLHFKRK
jgi:hypothetical protein